MQDSERYRACVIGRGTCHTLTERTGPNETSHISGFGPREAYDRAILVVDLTTIPWEEAVTFTVSGPMQAPIPAGEVHNFLAEPTTWTLDEPIPGRDPRFGNAGSMAYVATDVWLRIARSFGAHIAQRGEPEFGYDAYLARHEAD